MPRQNDHVRAQSIVASPSLSTNIVCMKIFTLAMLFPLLVKAQIYKGAVSSATANTGRAAVEISDSAYMNPASLAYMMGYTFTSSYSSTIASGEQQGNDFSLSLMDNMKETVIPTGLAYTQLKRDSGSYDLTTRDFRLSVGNFIGKKLALGLSLHLKDDQFPTNRFQQTNFSLGMIYAINNDLGLGFTMDDILDPSGKISQDIRMQSTTGLGLSYNYKKFARFRTDLVSASGNRFNKPTLGAGLESFMNRWIIIRLGLSRNFDEETSLYAAGLGFKGPRFAVHYAYQTSPQMEKLTRHSIDLAIPLW